MALSASVLSRALASHQEQQKHTQKYHDWFHNTSKPAMQALLSYVAAIAHTLLLSDIKIFSPPPETRGDSAGAEDNKQPFLYINFHSMLSQQPAIMYSYN